MERDTKEDINLNEVLALRRKKLDDLRERGKDPFTIDKYDRTAFTQKIKDDYANYEGKNVSVAGRIMTKREHGKASFADIQDIQGRIQVYVREDEIGKENYREFSSYDIGDIVGVKGEVFTTRKGEISIKAEEVLLLSKSLQVLPEKWHGLKDPDLRYRQRYVDLVVNPEVQKTFLKRSNIIKAIREYLDNIGYIEVETPILHTIAGGANAKPFITHHNTLDIDMYLRIATELHLKRLIVGGLEKVYEIGRIFRNEGMSIKHNPEFTSIELYEAYTDYNGMMEITENLIAYAANKVLGTTNINYQGVDIDLTPPWTRLTMVDAIKKYTGIEFKKEDDSKSAYEKAKGLGLEIDRNASKGQIINTVFEEKVEEHLIQPTFILDYPVEVSPLAK
ncbi:MAG: lysine--tRNA ligase, partial [Bacillota bacterium]